jgi:shikimate kinase
LKKSIILAGFMGTGKTVVGRLLARRLGLPFVDMDQWMEEREGESVKVIFRRHGEFYFRQREREAVRELTRGPAKVIATGGGTVATVENRLRLKEYGVLFCLTASPEVILERVKTGEERPLLGEADPKKRIIELLKIREESYRDSNHAIDTSALTPEEVAEEIIAFLRV